MDQSNDPEIQHLKKTVELLLRFEEAMLDALSESVASAREAGNLAKAAQMEEFIRQLRVDLLEQRALSAADEPLE